MSDCDHRKQYVQLPNIFSGKFTASLFSSSQGTLRAEQKPLVKVYQSDVLFVDRTHRPVCWKELWQKKALWTQWEYFTHFIQTCALPTINLLVAVGPYWAAGMVFQSWHKNHVTGRQGASVFEPVYAKTWLSSSPFRYFTLLSFCSLPRAQKEPEGWMPCLLLSTYGLSPQVLPQNNNIVVGNHNNTHYPKPQQMGLCNSSESPNYALKASGLVWQQAEEEYEADTCLHRSLMSRPFQDSKLQTVTCTYSFNWECKDHTLLHK